MRYFSNQSDFYYCCHSLSCMFFVISQPETKFHGNNVQSWREAARPHTVAFERVLGGLHRPFRQAHHAQRG